MIEGQATSVPLAVAAVVLWFVASGAFVTDQQTLLVNALPSARALGSAWNTSSMHAGTALGVWLIGGTGIERGVEIIAPTLAGIAVAAAYWLAAAFAVGTERALLVEAGDDDESIQANAPARLSLARWRRVNPLSRSLVPFSLVNQRLRSPSRVV